ncbi:MAG: hypothetical protein K2N25_03375, partial [Muribaculaceae bacterium]|nr:hypothetical protein [Muribaculaceae bacterium]
AVVVVDCAAAGIAIAAASASVRVIRIFFIVIYRCYRFVIFDCLRWFDPTIGYGFNADSDISFF